MYVISPISKKCGSHNLFHLSDFRECSLELLNHCYQQDDMMTMRLLTAELPNWGHHTCLSLAVIANNKRFLAHPW